MRRWRAYLAYGFLLIAAIWAAAHVAFHYRSQALARLAVERFPAFASGVWSFLVRANARWKEPQARREQKPKGAEAKRSSVPLFARARRRSSVPLFRAAPFCPTLFRSASANDDLRDAGPRLSANGGR
jgi:hypothetical protein